jgi:isopentenyldiphosphate isomerase
VFFFGGRMDPAPQKFRIPYSRLLWYHLLDNNIYREDIMEIWDIYDRDRNRTGRTVARGAELEPGDFHLVIHACVFNADGAMLIQRRQLYKDGWPGMWDFSVGGSAIAGETSAEAVSRELFEEVGLRHDFKDERPYITLHFSRGFDDIYIVERDVDLTTLTLQEEEVMDVAWATRDEVLALRAGGAFVPHRPGLIGLLFDADFIAHRSDLSL